MPETDREMSDPELFVLTASEISVVLGEAPSVVVFDTLSAWWFEDRSVSINYPTEPMIASAERPFELRVTPDKLAPEVRVALLRYVESVEVYDLIVDGDETIEDPRSRLK
jgi:hypothetical protein